MVDSGDGLAPETQPYRAPDEERSGESERPRGFSGVGEIVPTADKVSLVSWGAGSAPSIPAVDDEEQQVLTDDGDSGIGSLRSSTMSARSSIYDFIEENGRTYHRYKEGKYPLPNDLQEQERLDLQHALFSVTLHGSLYMAPIGDPKNVLDIATGTGIWAIEFAQQHPQARVLGTDLSPIQPQYIPPNVLFEVDDAEDEWTFSTRFDYIHGRALLSCFKDPSIVIREAFKSLAPGGYLELQDGYFPMGYVGDIPVDSALYKWNELVVRGAAKGGRPWTNVPHYKRWMIETGFEDVTERRFYWPTSPWAKGKYYKTVAVYFQEDMLAGLEAISLKVLGALGWTMDEVLVLLAEVRKNLRDTNIHAFMNIVIVWGRKPGVPES